jgi:hypothetical protein
MWYSVKIILPAPELSPRPGQYKRGLGLATPAPFNPGNVSHAITEKLKIISEASS